MDEMAWLAGELERSRAGFHWGIRQVPRDRLAVMPPSGLGEWPALRHLFHLVTYEQGEVVPSMHLWLTDHATIAEVDEDAAWATEQAGFELEPGLERLQAARSEQVDLLHKIDPDAWTATRETGWGTVSLRWVVSKTYQHTAEHTDGVLRLVLFWDTYVAAQARRQENRPNG